MTAQDTTTVTTDWFGGEVVEQLGAEARELWTARPLIAHYLQENFAAVFEAADLSELSLVERLSAAVSATRASGAQELEDAYYRRLEVVWGQPIPPEKRQKSPEQISNPRLRAIAEFSTLVAANPAETTENNYVELREAGLSESALVTLTLFVGFVSYQVRAIAGLRVLGTGK
jgi:uncharacterized protein YciW